MPEIRYSPEAVQDLREMLAYISVALDSPIAARSTVNKIRKHIQTLRRFPGSGERLDGYLSVKTDYRKLVCGNYLAFYRVESHFVNIIRILYGGRNYAKILFGPFVEEPYTEE